MLAWTLGFWLASLVFTGFAAGSTFASLRKLNPFLAQYDALPSGHDRLAGGHVVEPIFLLSDWVQGVCAALACVMLFVTRDRLAGRARWFVRVGVSLAVLLVLVKLIGLNPKMNADLHAFRAAIEAGDLSGASAPRERFDRMHPLASRVLVLTAAGVLVASISLPLAARGGRRDGAQSQPS